jgi:D-sedoheptulose 7-phosphate isomerase
MYSVSSKESIQSRANLIWSALDNLDDLHFNAIVERLRCAKEEDQTVWIAGNGGSASNAGHLHLHLTQCGLRCVDLSANVPLVTAIANDYSYRDIYVKQMKAVTEDDVVVLISGSGSSANINELARWASGSTVIGLLGMNGGMVKGMCKYALILTSRNYAVIEDVHSAIIHLLQEALS